MSDELERRLFEAWCAAEGLVPPPAAAVHPDDDMYRYGADRGLEPERRLALYLRSAREVERMLQHLLACAGRSFAELDSVLEFACGFGRFTRLLVRAVPPARVWASDLLPGTVDFVTRTFGVHGFDSATDPARLALPRRFDLIWVGSLFSHLPRERFEGFLGRLLDALEPGGLLVFSTHGAHVAPDVPKDACGFTFARESESAVLDAGEYGTAFVEPRVVRELARRAGATVLHHVERELWDLQDVHVAARAPRRGLAAWTNTPAVRGSIERAEVRPGGHAWIGGWARVPASAGRVERVTLRVAGLEVEAALSAPRELVVAGPEGERWSHVEWYVEGPSDALEPGAHPLCATGAPSRGAPACFDVRALRVPRDRARATRR